MDVSGGAVSVGIIDFVHIVDSVFKSNRITATKGSDEDNGWGGAVLIEQAKEFALIKGCIFANNQVNYRGGAISFISTCRPFILDSQFDNNEAVWGGGAVDIYYWNDYLCHPVES